MTDSEPREGMSTIVRTVTRWLKGFILLYGMYIVLYGHLTPGGGFAGGVIIANAFVLVMLAEGRQRGWKAFPKALASRLDCLGVLVFLLIGCFGMMISFDMFTNYFATPQGARYTLFSGGTQPLLNIAVGLKVGSSLFLVFAVLAAFRLAGEKPEDQGGDP
jgi:multicomponent Na+:H+ antiporter subunit B